MTSQQPNCASHAIHSPHVGSFFALSGIGKSHKTCSHSLLLKGALDKCNIYLFVSYSIEDFKLNQYPNLQLILPNAFSFYEVLCEQHHLQSVP